MRSHINSSLWQRKKMSYGGEISISKSNFSLPEWSIDCVEVNKPEPGRILAVTELLSIGNTRNLIKGNEYIDVLPM